MIRTAEHGEPALADWTAVPAVFGTSVYAFMCHHSIPSLVRNVGTQISAEIF